MNISLFGLPSWSRLKRYLYSLIYEQPTGTYLWFNFKPDNGSRLWQWFRWHDWHRDASGSSEFVRLEQDGLHIKGGQGNLAPLVCSPWTARRGTWYARVKFGEFRDTETKQIQAFWLTSPNRWNDFHGQHRTECDIEYNNWFRTSNYVDPAIDFTNHGTVDGKQMSRITGNSVAVVPGKWYDLMIVVKDDGVSYYVDGMLEEVGITPLPAWPIDEMAVCFSVHHMAGAPAEPAEMVVDCLYYTPRIVVTDDRIRYDVHRLKRLGVHHFNGAVDFGADILPPDKYKAWIQKTPGNTLRCVVDLRWTDYFYEWSTGADTPEIEYEGDYGKYWVKVTDRYTDYSTFAFYG